MKYCSPTLEHPVHPPRTRFRVPCHGRPTNPTSANQFPLRLINFRSTPSPYFTVRRQSWSLLIHFPQGPLNPIQNA